MADSGRYPCSSKPLCVRRSRSCCISMSRGIETAEGLRGDLDAGCILLKEFPSCHL